ncbi:MAG: permease [Chloroflexi bacterium]|nr:permease [Chloroflexota bacterium]
MTKSEAPQGGARRSTGRGGLIFLGTVVAVYAMVLVFVPETGLQALAFSASVLRKLAVPLSLVFAALLLTNLFLKPHNISSLVGKESGLKGSLLSLVAGVLSVGPVYAWYPLLGTVQSHGGGAGQISVFLFGRAIKPFLLPVMIAYFGLVFTIAITGLIAIGALVLGWLMAALESRHA